MAIGNHPPNSFILICSLITYFWLKITLPEYPMLYSFPGTHHHVIYYSYDVIPTINMWIPWKYTSLLYPGHLTENGTWQCMNKKYGNSLNTSLQHYLPTRQHSIWRSVSHFHFEKLQKHILLSIFASFYLRPITFLINFLPSIFVPSNLHSHCQNNLPTMKM